MARVLTFIGPNHGEKWAVDVEGKRIVKLDKQGKQVTVARFDTVYETLLFRDQYESMAGTLRWLGGVR